MTIATLLAVAAMAASVLYASAAQRDTARYHGVESALTESVLSDLNRANAALANFALTGNPGTLEDHGSAAARLGKTLAALHRAMADDADEGAALTKIERLVGELSHLDDRDLAGVTPGAQRAALRVDAGTRYALVDRIDAADAVLKSVQAAKIQEEDNSAARTAPLLILALSILFGSAAALAVFRSHRIARRTARGRALQERFGEAMQVSDSQAEAHGLLKTHLESSPAVTSITVLNRNNSADRLEPSTVLTTDSALADALRHARPRSCMAVRLSRPFQGGSGSEEILTCEICAVLEANTTCQPLLVGGEVIGAVLAEHHGRLVEVDNSRIAQSVAQAAPVLANLRNLAIAESRAATDALTGLPNRRAVDEALLRMLAQAGRSFNPLSVILLDLDHFKLINDTYGHHRGDEVLAAFGARLSGVLRTSDFAGRSGGEEFVIFLPDTDRTGAVALAQKLRDSMHGLTVPGVDRQTTASFGIACFPDDAVSAPALMRCADRALYAAKHAGRDRIEASSAGALIATTPQSEPNGAHTATVPKPPASEPA